jgi:hypothetical protein
MVIRDVLTQRNLVLVIEAMLMHGFIRFLLKKRKNKIGVITPPGIVNESDAFAMGEGRSGNISTCTRGQEQIGVVCIFDCYGDGNDE